MVSFLAAKEEEEEDGDGDEEGRTPALARSLARSRPPPPPGKKKFGFERAGEGALGRSGGGSGTGSGSSRKLRWLLPCCHAAAVAPTAPLSAANLKGKARDLQGVRSARFFHCFFKRAPSINR